MLLRLVCFMIFVELVISGANGQIKKSTKPWPPRSGEKDVCMTRECIGASHRIFELMNEKADPCQNFYEYACGGFIKNAIIDDDKSKASQWTPISDKIEQNGKHLLEAPVDNVNDFESDKLAKTYYKSCMNQEKLNELGIEPIQELVSQVGGWPVVEGNAWKHDAYNVWEQNIKAYHRGFPGNAIFTIYVSTDTKNNSHRVLHFDQANLGLSKEYWDKGIEEPEVEAYFKYMVETAVLFGADETKAKTELRQVMNFENDLAKISAPRKDRRNETKLYNPTTLGELSNGRARTCVLCPWGTGKVMPESWSTYVGDLFHFDVFFRSVISITDSEKVIIRDTKFFEQLSSILQGTDPRTLANYMVWRMIKASMKYLGKDAREIRQRYRKVIKGIATEKSPWKRCTNLVGFNSFDSKLNYAAGSMYARHIFDIEAKRQVDDMTNYVRKAFMEMLEKLDWMDEETKREAFTKLEKIHQTLAYPVEYLDQEIIDGIHKGLVMAEDDFLGNVLKLSVHFKKIEVMKLRENVDPYDWRDFENVAVVNAFYNPDFNKMEFPAGILQGGFFNSKLPRYMNFGGIGMVIGHEITHGFDDQGRQRNSDGALMGWWKPETVEIFENKAECIISQYGNYTVKQVGLKLNGIVSQGENIADNGGIKEAYLGYEKWVEENGVEPGLPGHGFTPKQFFWLSHAQTWCTKMKDEAMKRQVLVGPHSPPEFRVIGALSNAKQFSQDWQCPPGSPMNPVEKCTVW